MPQQTIEELYEQALERKQNPQTGSYTDYLYQKGLDKILKKVGEESTEVILGAKNNNEELIYETSDLLFHLMVLLVEKGVSLDDIKDELGSRLGKKSILHERVNWRGEKKMKKTVQALAAYQAELPVETAKEKYGLQHLARLSANESVYGPSPKVASAVRAVSDDILGYYPDGQATELRDAVAKLNHVDPQHLVFGAGADELIELLTRVVLEPGSNIIIPDPTFGEYAMHAQIEQSITKKIPVNVADGHVDFDAILDAIDDKTAMVWIANPNNPTGVFEKTSAIKRFLDKLPASITLVVDEAYYDFVDEPDATVAPLVTEYTNLVILRTLSKAYGLANLRVGYGIMQDPLYTAMQAVRLPYNLSTYQIAGGTAAVLDQEYLQANVQRFQVERQTFQEFLTQNKFKFYESQANFIWIKVGETKKVGQKLLEQGFQVNDRLNPEWIRIALGTPEDNAELKVAFLKATKQ